MAIRRVTPKEKEAPKRLRRRPIAKITAAAPKKKPDMRWKNKERDVSRKYQEIDGATENAALKILQTSTGRLGHLNALRVDSASKNYMIEVKRRILVGWLHKAWALIVQKALDFGVHPVLVLCMTDTQNTITYNGKEIKCPDMHVIDEDRHKQLLEYERLVLAMSDQASEINDESA